MNENMGELVKHKKNEIYIGDDKKVVVPSSIPVTRKNKELYLSGRNFPKIYSIKDKNEVVKSIHIYINKTIMDKGVNVPSDEIQYLKQAVTDDIMRDFSHFTLEEVRLALHYGVRGDMGEFFGINPATIYNWLRKYRFELLPPISKEMTQYLEKPKEEKTPPQEVDQKIADTLCEVYFKLCTSGEYNYYDLGNVGYRLLDELELMPFSNAEKHGFMEESREHFELTIKKKNRTLVSRGKSIQKIDIKRACKQLEEKSNPTFEHQIRIGAMRLAVHKCLYNFAEEEIDLKELIDNKLSEKIYDDENN